MHEHARRDLRELLVRSFTVAELRIGVCDLDSSLAAFLPADAINLWQFADSVITCLEQRRMLDDSFFMALTRARPLLAEEIDAIRRRLTGTAAPSAMARPPAPVFEGPRGVSAMALRDFTGRAQALTALERLLKDHATVCVVASGIGGIGKTTLVQEFVARRAADCFPDGSAWLDGQAIIGELARVARRFGWSVGRDPTPDEARTHLHTTLTGQRFLLVVDNVDPDGDPSLVPVLGGSCRTLVTSRKTTLHLDLDNAAPLELDLWSLAECLEFFGRTGVRRARDTDEDLRALAEFVGCLPLGVRMVAMLLAKRPGTAATALLGELRCKPLAVLERYRGRYPGLAATFQTTWDALADKSRRVLLALAACANGTRTEIVTTVSGVDDAAIVLDDLATRSLVLCTPTPITPWALHDIVRMFLLEQPGFAESAQSHLEWVERHLAAHEDPLSHAEFAAGTAEATRAFLRSVEQDKLNAAIRVYEPLRTHLFQIGQGSAFIALAEALLTRAPEDSAFYAMCLTDIGNCCQVLGDLHKAIEHHELALAINLKLARVRGQATALGNLGACYSQLGDIRRAIDHHERALAIEVEVGRVAGEAYELAALGCCYQVLKETTKAIEFNQRALYLYVRDNHLEGQAQVFGNLGLCYRDHGELCKAIEYHERALHFEKNLNQIEGQARDLSSLGICYRLMGDLPKAIAHHEQALAIDEKLGRLAGQATDLGCLGLCYRALGDLPAAIRYIERALAIAAAGDFHAAQAAHLCNLGVCLEELGEIPRAIECHERALAICERLGRIEEQANALSNLGDCYEKRGDPSAARDFRQRALELFRRVGLSDAHPSVRTVLEGLARR